MGRQAALFFRFRDSALINAYKTVYKDDGFEVEFQHYHINQLEGTVCIEN